MAEDINPEDLEIADELIAERRSLDPDNLPNDMPGWMSNTIRVVDKTNIWVGKVVCWFLVPMCLSMVYEVMARKFFIAPTMWAYDISRMLYGALFMLGAAYALLRGVHIRADFIYRNWSDKTQGWIDGTLYLVFYFPGLLVFLWMSMDYAWAAISIGEKGMDTAWMPYMGPIKSTIPIGIVLLLMQGVSEFFKCIYAITTGRWPK